MIGCRFPAGVFLVVAIMLRFELRVCGGIADAHAWDPTGSRLFVAGGPLASGLQGSYMAVWQ